MKTILVTGASGFVGTHFIRQYASEYKILAIWKSNVIAGQNVLSLQMDLSNNETVLSTLDKTRPEVILHLAGKAKLGDGSSLEDMIEGNMTLTKNLLDAVFKLKEKDGYDPKILIVTSAEIYGKTTNPKSIDETLPFFPVSEYGLSKLFVDRMAFYYSHTKNMNIIILRSFNHIGPGQKLGFFVSDMASQIANIERGMQDHLTVGNLTSVRDILDVRDVIRAYFLAIETNLKSGEAYNLCSGKGISMKQLLDKLILLSTSTIKVVEDSSRMRASDNPVSIGSNKKFRAATKWKPEIDLDRTLKDCMAFWRNNA